MTFEEILQQYAYDLPPELVAKAPAHPRDRARLLVFDRRTGRVTTDVFRNIRAFLPPRSVLVLNETKVLPARMRLRKATGGKVEALYLCDEGDRDIRALAPGSLHPGNVLQWEEGHTFTVLAREGRDVVLRPHFDRSRLFTLLEQYGETPLPPYIADSPLTEEDRRIEYQTVYAREGSSVAAPTAGLHFTQTVLDDLQQSGIALARITLDVGLGTFAPLTEQQWQERRLHAERYRIGPEAAGILRNAKAQQRPIIAVGTTTVRALESASDGQDIVHPEGRTTLLITEHDPPRFTDGLITNFHLPRSSLMMLVAAFTGREKLLELYRLAIAQRMRFYSFGDAMLVL